MPSPWTYADVPSTHRESPVWASTLAPVATRAGEELARLGIGASARAFHAVLANVHFANPQIVALCEIVDLLVHILGRL